MRFSKFSAASIAIAVAFAGSSALAATCNGPLTGTPSPNSSFSPNSTNLLNFDQQVPGRVGQVAPYVLCDSADVGEVSLNFSNAGPGQAFFEYRIDGISAGTTSHPVVSGDTIHPGVNLFSGDPDILQTFSANQFVEVRLALGGERDWDFDWTRFDVQPVPLPAAGWLLLTAFGGLGLAARRRRKTA